MRWSVYLRVKKRVRARRFRSLQTSRTRNLYRFTLVAICSDLDFLMNDVVYERIVADDKHMMVLLLKFVQEPGNLHAVLLVHHEEGFVDDKQVTSHRPCELGECHLDR